MSAKAFAVIIKPLIDMYGEPKNWAVKRDLYFETLRDIPEHLLNRAVKHCIGDCDFFPRPSELRHAVLDEISDYRRCRDAAARAALPKPAEPPEATAEDFAYVRNLVAKATQAVADRSMMLKRGEDQ